MKKVIQFLKFYLSKLHSSKYVVKGKCRMCGVCCRNIVFYIKDESVKTPEEFDRMKKFNKAYNNFSISGRKADGTLLFRCNSLTEDGKCRDYLFRSIYCRLYPNLGTKILSGKYETFDGCGYNIEVNKKFKTYLTKKSKN